jgi:alpha-1,2-mannosyltransferase
VASFIEEAVAPVSKRAEPLGTFLISALFVPLLYGGLALWAVFMLGYASHRSDFMQDYVAGYSLRHHLPLYGESSEQLTRRLLGIKGQYNFHPPTNAILFVPLTYLPYKAAFIAWNVAGLLALFLLLKTIVADTQLPLPIAKLLGAAVLVWPPFVANAALGQVSLYTALALLWGWRLFARGQAVRGSVVLGAISVIKLFPLIFIAFLIATRRWRAALAFAAVVVVGVAATWLVVGADTFVLYFRQVIPENTRVWSVFPLNTSIPGVVAMLSRPGGWASTLLEPSAGAAVTIVACGAIVGVTTWVSVVASGARSAEEQSYIAFCVAMLLVSPLTWSHTFLLLIWPAATLVRDWRLVSQSVRAEVIGAYVLLSLPTISLTQAIINHYLPRAVPWPLALTTKLPTLGLIVLWIVFCRRTSDARALSLRRVASCSGPSTHLRGRAT